MDACLAAGVDYLDTANYEPPDVAKFEYKWQWAYQDRSTNAGRMALLGSGFDPGVTNVFCAYAQKHLFDEIHTSTSSTATPAATARRSRRTSTPRSTSARSRQRGRYWENGEWKETEPLSVSMDLRLPRASASARASSSITRSSSRW